MDGGLGGKPAPPYPNTKERRMPIKIYQANLSRDENGYWTHPDFPAFDEGQSNEARAWFSLQQLEVHVDYLESESMDHPACVAYFDAFDPNISSWQPAAPSGDGWFALSIHDTEDSGPVWVWARRTAQQSETK
jgi:hypothetical protein